MLGDKDEEKNQTGLRGKGVIERQLWRTSRKVYLTKLNRLERSV